MNSQIRQILEDSCPQCDRGTVLDGYDNASCGEMIHNETFLDQAEKALVDYFIELIDGVVPKPTSIELMGVEKAKAELRAKLKGGDK